MAENTWANGVQTLWPYLYGWNNVTYNYVVEAHLGEVLSKQLSDSFLVAKFMGYTQSTTFTLHNLPLQRVYLGTTPHPVTATTRILPFLVGGK